MGSFSIWHLLIVAGVVVLLFGRGRISDVMGDFAAGIRNFRKELRGTANEPQAIGTERQLADAAERSVHTTAPR